VIVVDTSAWVELLRGTGRAAHRTLRNLLDDQADLAVTEVVVMELLTGAGSDAELRELRSRIRGLHVFPLKGLEDYEEAVALYRACRDGGETIRDTVDCLVAVPAIRAGAPMLHDDVDFDKLARHTPLEVVTLDE